MIAILVISVISIIIILGLVTALYNEWSQNQPTKVFSHDIDYPIVIGRDENEIGVWVGEEFENVEGNNVRNQTNFKSPHVQSGEDFGHATAVSHDYIAISAPGHGTSIQDNGSGCVYVFKKSNAMLYKTVYPPKPSPGLSFGDKIVIETTDKTVRMTVFDINGKTYSIDL
jgi:hypothetical protein